TGRRLTCLAAGPPDATSPRRGRCPFSPRGSSPKTPDRSLRRLPMSPRTRRVLAATAAAALVLAGAAACAPDGPSDASADASSAKGTITWLSSPLGPAGTDARTALVAAFEKANPGITVKFVNAPASTDTTRSTLTTQISGGATTPDVYNGDVVWPAQFGQAGLAMPLSDHLPADFWNRFTPGLV